ncbi:hypothetical protein FSARC_4677 [Fusarium sarcochroum]|uniref:Uncharacterized protein n=1 Tax=Fusarium sarcochroum TaxID=1208366 RepID=A0A8H4U160_9HYPO|nr:hypothetical protein FSARC_4677 [Fusarium sarcochroum]
MATLEFPSLQSPSLSQEHKDQEDLKLVKTIWDKCSYRWDHETKVNIIRHLRDIRETQTNRKLPSRHKLYKVDFNFGIWILLRCIYPGQKLDSFKVLLMQKYPGVDPNTFEGSGLGKMTQEETETEMVTPSFSKQKLLEEDDTFDYSDFPIKREDVTLGETHHYIAKEMLFADLLSAAELRQVSEIQSPPSDDQVRADKRNAEATSQDRQDTSKAGSSNDKYGSGPGQSRMSRLSPSRLSLKSLEPQLRAIESTFRTMIHEGPSRGHYDAFVKKKANKWYTLADILSKDKGAERMGVWAERGSDVGSLTNSESDFEGGRSKSAFSDQQYQELKTLISNTNNETKGVLSGEMLDMQTMIMKKLQSMNVEMTKQFKDSQKQMLDVGRQVTGLRGVIESVRRVEKDIQELEAKVVNLEEFITSL